MPACKDSGVAENFFDHRKPCISGLLTPSRPAPLKRNESFFERPLDKLELPLYTPLHTSGAAETQGRTDG
jgi:hypothetical protein